MLTMTVILLIAACLLIGTYAVMTGRFKQQLAAVEHDVRAGVDAKTKASQEADKLLSKRLVDGKPIAAAIDQWQQGRAEILQTGRASRPWSWSSEDLRAWSRERCRSLGDEIRRRFFVAFVLSTVTIVLFTGAVTAVCYHIYSSAQSPGSIPTIDGGVSSLPVPIRLAEGALEPPP